MKKLMIVIVAALLLSGCQKSPAKQLPTEPTTQTTGENQEAFVDIGSFEDPTVMPTEGAVSTVTPENKPTDSKPTEPAVEETTAPTESTEPAVVPETTGPTVSEPTEPAVEETTAPTESTEPTVVPETTEPTVSEPTESKPTQPETEDSGYFKPILRP